MKFTRYALFFTPAPGPLADFGSAWIGWDAATGREPTPPQFANLPMPRAEITKTPRKYGFHGTLKTPFRLAMDQSEEALHQALADFCATRSQVALEGMEFAQLGRFLALVPTGDNTALNALAADTVRSFDRFRAPLTSEELARRQSANLTSRQDALLHEWGYPYVMEEFRFHLTLTDKLPKAKATQLRATLEPHLTPIIPVPFVIDALSLVGEGPDGLFREIGRCPLAGQG